MIVVLKKKLKVAKDYETGWRHTQTISTRLHLNYKSLHLNYQTIKMNTLISTGEPQLAMPSSYVTSSCIVLFASTSVILPQLKSFKI